MLPARCGLRCYLYFRLIFFFQGKESGRVVWLFSCNSQNIHGFFSHDNIHWVPLKNESKYIFSAVDIQF